MDITLISGDSATMLEASGLNDPPNWTRFRPFNTLDSERVRFDVAVEQHARILGIQVTNLLGMRIKGNSIWRYETLNQDLILMHAMTVAEALDVDLDL